MTYFKRNKKGNLITQIGKDRKEYLIPKYKKSSIKDTLKKMHKVNYLARYL